MHSLATEANIGLFVLYIYHTSFYRSEVTFL